jgi:hypothetical protein
MNSLRWRTSIRLACAAAALGGTLIATPLAGHASADVNTCTGETSWGFTAGLGTGTSYGTINAAYTYVCHDVYYQNSWGTRVGQNAYQPNWTDSYPYSGSCALASFRYGYNYSTASYEGSGLLVGGAVAVATSGNSNYSTAEIVETDVMAPLLAPCLESSALGSSTVAFVGAY